MKTLKSWDSSVFSVFFEPSTVIFYQIEKNLCIQIIGKESKSETSSTLKLFEVRMKYAFLKSRFFLLDCLICMDRLYEMHKLFHSTLWDFLKALKLCRQFLPFDHIDIRIISRTTTLSHKKSNKLSELLHYSNGNMLIVLLLLFMLLRERKTKNYIWKKFSYSFFSSQ
jgi:hypothetical protein